MVADKKRGELLVILFNYIMTSYSTVNDVTVYYKIYLPRFNEYLNYIRLL